MKKNVGAGIIFIAGNEILLLKNKKGLWEIPGGRRDHVEEKLIDVARRETAEEIGHSPTFQKIGYYVSEKPKHKFKIYYGLVKKKFNCSISDEHEDWKWFNIKNLPQNLHNKIIGAIKLLKKSDIFNLG